MILSLFSLFISYINFVYHTVDRLLSLYVKFDHNEMHHCSSDFGILILCRQSVSGGVPRMGAMPVGIH